MTINTRNILLRDIDLSEQYPNRKKECIACNSIYFVSLKKTIGKSKYCSRECSDKNQVRGLRNKGKSVSIETREKLSQAVKGEKSYLWKSGITKVNQLIRQGLDYRLWRESVFKRDNYSCQECGERGCYLEAHHIKSFAHYPELRFDVENGVALCRKCHQSTETYATNLRTI